MVDLLCVICNNTVINGVVLESKVICSECLKTFGTSTRAIVEKAIRHADEIEKKDTKQPDSN